MVQLSDIALFISMLCLFLINGKFGDAKGILSGVTQLENFDPYKENYFQTIALQGVLIHVD